MSAVIQPTRRLYEEDAYCREFTAAVTEYRPAGEPGVEAGPAACVVVLDRTAFFPEGGGQSADTGRIAGFEVEDVQLRADGAVEHRLRIPAGTSGETLLPGQTVSCEIDWVRRFGFMQCHTGEHILSGLMHGIHGFDNIGFHLSEHSVTLDVNGQLSQEQIEELELAANEVVWKNVPVTARFPSDEELETLRYRSKKEIEGPLRIVTVEGVDVCACCAPHVRRTGEIGSVRILRVLRYNGGMRLTIACGSRALPYTQSQQRQAEQVSHLISKPQEEIAAGVERVLGELEQSRTENRLLRERIAELCLDNARRDSRGNIWVFEDSLSVITQRNLVNSLCAREERAGTAGNAGFCGVFTMSGEKGYTYIVGSFGGADAREVSKFLARELAARGGGKPQMVQGSVKADREVLLALLSELG